MLERLRNFFTNCDANAILALPIPKTQVSDRIAWTFSVDGKYSMKSGYKFWQDNYGVLIHEQNNEGWKKLWQLEVPHKVRVSL